MNPDPPKEMSDAERIRRVVDSAFGTDACHGLIAQALADAGWVGPETVAAREAAATVKGRQDAAHVIEASFRSWDALGDAQAPHPLHSQDWLVERVYEIAADLARRCADPAVAAEARADACDFPECAQDDDRCAARFMSVSAADRACARVRAATT